MKKQIINSTEAPKAIGPYSQAVQAGDTVYLSGQIPLDPETMTLISDNVEEQARQVFTNLQAVVKETGGSFGDIVKLTIYLTDLQSFQVINAVMTEFFTSPFPARATIGVAALPAGAQVEVEGVMILQSKEEKQ